MTLHPPAAQTPAHALRHAPGGAVARPAWLLAWALALAIALAPLLGHMHRVVHFGDTAGAAVQAQQGGNATPDWVHALFDGHGPAGCQLLDQHHHGLAGPPAALVLPPLWADQASICPHRSVRDGRMRVAFFHARAPPRAITAALKA